MAKKTKATRPVAKKVIATTKKVVKKATKRKASSKSNGLTAITGIGPKMEALLKTLGITDIATLATADANKLKDILAKANSRYSMLNPATWIEAAKKATK